MPSFLTWNIWGKNLSRVRFNEIIKVIIEQTPDFFALQEVPLEILEDLKIKNYFMIGYPFKNSYDVVLFSKHACISWTRYPLPNTKTGRNVLVGDFILPNCIMSVATFHLESEFKKGSDKLKIMQLNYIFSIVQDITILMGDTNILSKEPIDDISLMKVTDIFESIGSPKDLEDTYSGITNTNICNKLYNSRLDRVYSKVPPKLISKFKLVGSLPIYNEKHLSDHYGILVELLLI